MPALSVADSSVSDYQVSRQPGRSDRDDAVRLRGLERSEQGSCATRMQQTVVVGWDVLIVILAESGPSQTEAPP
jgi:hypothetical protein